MIWDGLVYITKLTQWLKWVWKLWWITCLLYWMCLVRIYGSVLSTPFDVGRNRIVYHTQKPNFFFFVSLFVGSTWWVWIHKKKKKTWRVRISNSNSQGLLILPGLHILLVNGDILLVEFDVWYLGVYLGYTSYYKEPRL